MTQSDRPATRLSATPVPDAVALAVSPSADTPHRPRRPVRGEDPVAAHMVPVPVTVDAEGTVAQALARLRGQALGGRIVYFYAVDADGRLVGVVPTRRLLMAEPETAIAAVMVEAPLAVHRDRKLSEALRLLQERRLLALPVVDDDGRPVGVVDVGTVADEVADDYESWQGADVFQLVGVRLAEADERSAWRQFRARFPWLTTNVAGGLLSGLIVAAHEDVLHRFAVLVLLLPVVLAVAESVAMQALTLTLQRLHAGAPGAGGLMQLLGRDLRGGLLLGGAIGGMVGTIAMVWKGDATAALGVWISVGLGVVVASLVAVAVPTAIRVVGADPRLAAGPLVLAAADVAALMILFTVCGSLPA